MVKQFLFAVAVTNKTSFYWQLF